MIWLPELTEPAENFEAFFNRADNKIRSVRNVWLLNYRNQGGSDQHESYDMEEMTDDIIRFMDKNQITMATIGGHGFGAKLAAATANANTDRFTGVISLEGGPLDHRYHEAYQELEQYVTYAKSIDLNEMDYGQAVKALKDNIACPKWASIFCQNLKQEGSNLHWKTNYQGLYRNMKKFEPDVAIWSQSYGLWPGQALALFASHSRWIHLSTNTLPFYNVFPRLEGQFPTLIGTHADGFESPLNHWIHEHPKEEVFYLANRMFRWLRYNDGANVMLADKTEAGWYFVPDRGYDL